jgi:arylsulfatase A-like enzyme
VVRVVEEHDKSSPLFMYIAFQNIHPPLQVPQPFVDMQRGPELRTEVNGMVTFLDESMGNLTAALKRTGLWANLLLVYSPDNGGYLGNGGDDTPLRGGKFSDFQVRVAPLLVPILHRGHPGFSI